MVPSVSEPSPIIVALDALLGQIVSLSLDTLPVTVAPYQAWRDPPNAPPGAQFGTLQQSQL